MRWWHPGFALTPAQVLGVPCFVPDPGESYLAEGYRVWRSVPAELDPRLDARNVEVTDPAYLETLTYAALMAAMQSNQRPAYQRHVRLPRERGEGPWLDRLRVGTS